MRELWEVEWWSSAPEEPGGGVDLDRAVTEADFFTTERRARAFAKRVAGRAVFGVANVTRYVEVSASWARETGGLVMQHDGRWWEVSGDTQEVAA